MEMETEEGIGSPELELQTDVSYDVGAENWSQGHLEEQWVLLPEPSFQLL